MASTATPYGMRPVSLIGGRVYAGSTRKLPITSAYATNIFFGDAVKLGSNNTIEKDTGTTTATPIGVFLGASWMDTTFGFTFRQYWPASTAPQSNAQPSATVSPQAFICDDHLAVFMIQADATVAAGNIGKNAALVQGSGSTTTGDSAVSLSASSIATTAGLPLRIIDYVYGPNSAPGDAFTDLLVIWNFGTHRYQVALGT